MHPCGLGLVRVRGEATMFYIQRQDPKIIDKNGLEISPPEETIASFASREDAEQMIARLRRGEAWIPKIKWTTSLTILEAP
jgi:hypothetical protein